MLGVFYFQSHTGLQEQQPHTQSVCAEGTETWMNITQQSLEVHETHWHPNRLTERDINLARGPASVRSRYGYFYIFPTQPTRQRELSSTHTMFKNIHEHLGGRKQRTFYRVAG